MKGPSRTSGGDKPDSRWANERFFAIALLVAYVVIRLVAWHQVRLLEDFDGLGYLEEARAWRTFDYKQIAQLSPDSTPLYPLAIALVSRLGVDLEPAARAVSFAFSLLLFQIVFEIGRRLVGWLGACTALLLMTLNSPLVGLSIAVLSEPAHIAITYLGFWLFYRGAANPRPGQAALCGLVFALGFLARTEGLLWLILLPILQVLHWLCTKRTAYSARRLAVWVAAFGVTFAVVALPQVVSVSSKLGFPAINGRQVWFAAMNSHDARPAEQKAYGLDYSSTQTNLVYLRKHPAEAKRLGGAKKDQLRDTVAVVQRNLEQLLRYGLRDLLGWPVVLALAWGLIAFARSRASFDILFVLLVAGGLSLGPLLYNIVLRHVAILIPLALLIAAYGVVDVTERLARKVNVAEVWLLIAAVGPLLLGLTAWRQHLQLAALLVHPPRENGDYRPEGLVAPARVVRAVAAQLAHPVRICATRDYLAELAGASFVPLPFSSYPELLHYLDANQADLLFLEDGLLQSFPFLAQMRNVPNSASPPRLKLLQRSPGVNGADYELYELTRVGESD